MNQTPGFNGAKIRAVEDTLQERYRQPVELQRVDIDLPLHPDGCEQFVTGSKHNDDLLDCLITLLRAQADQALQNNPVRELNP